MNQALMLQTIDFWEYQAKEEVKHAKTLSFDNVINPHSYLIGSIWSLAEVLKESSSYIPQNDFRYRVFVLAILNEYKNQGLPLYEEFLYMVITGKLLINSEASIE
jgi:hypothetical protein